MGSYHEWKFDTLLEAIKFCETSRSERPSVVFRGQANATWELKANLFRFRPTQEEVHRRFTQTLSFIDWCRSNKRLPPYSDEQMFQIAQHYGMYTDLLDFTTDLNIAALFALDIDMLSFKPKHSRAALFVVDPVALEKISHLNVSVTPSYKDIIGKYKDIYHANEVQGLSRLVAQKGVFIRDPHGTLEKMTDDAFSVIPMMFESQFGYTIGLRKVSFTPAARDLEALSKKGYTHSFIYPPPNDVEREVGRFKALFKSVERTNELDASSRVTIEIAIPEDRYEFSARKEWSYHSWKSWHHLNLTTNKFELKIISPYQRKIGFSSEAIFKSDYAPQIISYVANATKNRQGYRSHTPISIYMNDSEITLPQHLQVLLEVLLGFPLQTKDIVRIITRSFRLYLATLALSKEHFLSDIDLKPCLKTCFGDYPSYEPFDFIAFDDEYSFKALVPTDGILAFKSVRKVCKEYLHSKNQKTLSINHSTLKESLFEILFQRPSFRGIFTPKDALLFWSSYIIPYQIVIGEWQSAILNPFQIEFLGFS